MINRRHPFTYRAILLLLALPPAVVGDELNRIIERGDTRAQENVAAQRQIDQSADETDNIFNDFKTTEKIVDGLHIYNSLFQTQIDNQTEEMNALQDSIGKVSLIERQIIPLMTRMIQALEKFVALDIPFLEKERTERVERLNSMMVRADVTTAEKFRRVMEAYQIESEYGRMIEAYKGSLEIEGNLREVDFLRIGRVALLYQGIGGEHTGAWNQQESKWQKLSPEQYKQHTAIGLRIARKQVAPQLLVVPVMAATEAGK